jgi:hypothetical protein
MLTFKRIVAACALAGSLAVTSTLSARAGEVYVAPGAFFGSGSGVGGNLSTDIAPLGGSATLRGAATIATDNHSTAFGVGLDAIAHSEGVYYGAGANVFFPSCSDCHANFSPDLIAGFHVAPNIAIETRYYLSTQADSSGSFFGGLQFKLK